VIAPEFDEALDLLRMFAPEHSFPARKGRSFSFLGLTGYRA
jgi:hypothetical protein